MQINKQFSFTNVESEQGTWYSFLEPRTEYNGSSLIVTWSINIPQHLGLLVLDICGF